MTVDMQEKMESHLEKTAYENSVVQKDTMNGMMKSETVGCSYEERTLSIKFPVQEWQANRAGGLHGGMVCTAFDITIAALARFFAGENFAPTVSIDVKYIRPAKPGQTIVVTARATGLGKRISQFVADMVDMDSGKTIATASSIYLNIDTSDVAGGRG